MRADADRSGQWTAPRARLTAASGRPERLITGQEACRR
jgi:hypothetical protein